MLYFMVVIGMLYMLIATIAPKVAEGLPSFPKDLALFKEREAKKKQQQDKQKARNAHDKAWPFYAAGFVGQADYTVRMNRVEAAIYKLAGDRDWSVRTKCNDSSEICLQRLAAAFVAEAYEHDLPPLLLVSRAWHESRLTAFRADGYPIRSKPDPRNGKVDVGILQLRPPASNGCKMSTVRGQIACGASYTRKKLNRFNGNIVKALTAYACGHYPSKKPRTFNWVVPRSFILWQALEKDCSAESLKQINELGRKRQQTFQMSDWGSYGTLYNPGLEV